MIKLNDSAKLFFSLGSIILMVISMYYLRPILAPLSFSFIFAVILLPPTAFLERKGFSPSIAALITVVFASMLVVSMVLAATWQISTLTDNSADLTEKVEKGIHNGIITIEKSYPQLKKQNLINYRLRTTDLFKRVGENISNSTSGLAAFVSNALLMPLFIFFILAYRQFFREFLHQVINSENQYVDNVLNKIYLVMRSYLTGMITVMAIVGALNAVGLMVIGVPYAIFFAVLASILMVIPYLGVFIGSLLPCIMALITYDSPWPAVGVAAWMWGVQIVEANFITPNLVGSKVSINPFAAIISLIVMGQLWELAGLVLAMPFVAILKIILDAIPSTQPYGMLLGEVHCETKKTCKTEIRETKEALELADVEP